VRAAAAIALGLALSPIAAGVPSVAAAGLPTAVSVTMIATLTVPERTTAFIDPVLLESYTGPTGLLTRELDQVIDRPIALGIDPSIIASIRVLGTSAPESATAWLERLDAATNETFPLAWADADVTLGLQAGSAQVLAPESFAYAIDPGRFVPAAPDDDPTATPEPTETPVPNELPTDETLAAWDYTVPEITWPAMNSVAAADLETLSAEYGTTILSSQNTGSATARQANATVGTASVIVADETLSAQFGATVSAFSGSAWQAAMTNLAAAVSAVESTEGSSASILIAVGRDVSLSDPDFGATVELLAQQPNIQVTALTDLLATDPVKTQLVDMVHSETQIDKVAAMLDDASAEEDFLSIASSPSLITSQRRLELLAATSNSWSDNMSGWASAVQEFTDTSLRIRNSVRIVKSSSITLWADRASLPVTITNELSQPVTVYVTVRPLTPLLKVEDNFVEVTVEPQSQRKATVPVQSLSNGIVELEITLHDSIGHTVGDLTYVRTTVQAGWETPVTVSFGIAVVIVFALGIVRTIVRRRRALSSER
jgi:hypothetical protein